MKRVSIIQCAQYLRITLQLKCKVYPLNLAEIYFII